MYPFDRFTDAAKKTLTLAQEEAERSRHAYIGSEHLLIALLNQQGTVASMVLARLGVRLGRVRPRIEEVLGRNERIFIEQILPTSRVKRVIELAFEESRRDAEAFVGTHHLLLGLLIDGEGTAAHVLEERGANLGKVRSVIAEVKSAGTAEDAAAGAGTQSSIESALLRRLGELSSAEARDDLSQVADETHVLRALIRMPPGRVARILARLGVDVAWLLERLRPPQEIIELRRDLRAASQEKRRAAQREDYTAAERARQREDELRAQLIEAERRWRTEDPEEPPPEAA